MAVRLEPVLPTGCDPKEPTARHRSRARYGARRLQRGVAGISRAAPLATIAWSQAGHVWGCKTHDFRATGTATDCGSSSPESGRLTAGKSSVNHGSRDVTTAAPAN